MTIGRFFKSLPPVHFVLFYIFITSGLIVNFVQLLTLAIWPFSKKLYRKINIYLAYCFWSTLTALAQYWSGSTCTLYMKEEDFKYVGTEHSICIMNHKYDVDWLMGWILCQRVGLLAGSKVIGKSSLKFIPLIGWCWIFTESIFIKRKWEQDHKTLVEGLQKILVDYPDNYFFNILMFCEGTRFTKNKHEQSMKIAREKGLKELEHHLLPRTKGFSMLARGSAGRIGAVYDLTVGVDQRNAKAEFNTVRNGIPLKSEMYVRRIPMCDVPQDEEGSAKFVHKLYQEKDEVFDVYAKTGSFESLGAKKIELIPNYYDFYIAVAWTILLCTPLFYYLIAFMKSATILMNLFLLIVLFILSFAAKLFISVTESGSGSKYGVVTQNPNGTNKKIE